MIDQLKIGLPCLHPAFRFATTSSYILLRRKLSFKAFFPVIPQKSGIIILQAAKNSFSSDNQGQSINLPPPSMCYFSRFCYRDEEKSSQTTDLRRIQDEWIVCQDDG